MAPGVRRLDLGAGHKRQEGWIRVDLPLDRVNLYPHDADASDHFTLDPDIACDLSAIPLPDDWADQARAIHVIEHFYPWATQDVLNEWVRVLKPGGELAIECPCMEKVLALAQVPEMPPQYVHWALYGDPRYKDERMCHHWIYTRTQLAKMMGVAGLEEIRPETPKFHVPIRDMRLVGIKARPGKVIITK